jgi:hypothetical protein
VSAPADIVRTPRSAGLPRAAVAATVAGALVCIVGLIVDPRRIAAAYLVAYVAVLAVGLGALAMIMIARVTAATWFVALRRQAEQVVAVLPVLAILFVPVVVALGTLYPWTHPSLLADELRRRVEAKSAYLNPTSFVVRAVVYWAIWLVLGEMLRRASLAEEAGSPGIRRRTYVLSAVGLPLFALATSFASFDWMMSLAPAWYSTIYGVDYFAGGMVGALALLALLVARAHHRGELTDGVSHQHLHALGKLLLTFVLFWVYIGFSQLIVIWSAEIPVEAAWYRVRMNGGWWWLGAVLVAGHFAIPFLALLFRAVKRSVVAMTILGVLLLAMHYVDVYWIVMPDAGFTPAIWFDAGALLFIGGAASCTWALRRRGEASLPLGDPLLAASLDYRTE